MSGTRISTFNTTPPVTPARRDTFVSIQVPLPGKGATPAQIMRAAFHTLGLSDPDIARLSQAQGRDIIGFAVEAMSKHGGFKPKSVDFTDSKHPHGVATIEIPQSNYDYLRRFVGSEPPPATKPAVSANQAIAERTGIERTADMRAQLNARFDAQQARQPIVAQTTAVAQATVAQASVSPTAAQPLSETVATKGAKLTGKQNGIPPNFTPAERAALLDVTQIGLDIAGLVDPTGVADASNAVVSFARGDLLDGLVGLASILPFGDLAKIIKSGGYVKKLENIIALAKANPRFAEFIAGGMRQLKTLLDKIPTAKLPGVVRDAIESLKAKVDEFFAATAKQTPPRVAAPAGRADLYKSYKTDADVPAHYRNDSRFNDLSKDPDQGGKISPATRAEAMAGLEAEAQGVVKGPIKRGPRGVEFYDVNGVPYDVKTPPSPKVGEMWSFNADKSGKSIMDELRTKATPPGAPAGTFPHEKTGLPEPRRVILDSTYMNTADHKALWEWLNKNLTPDELNRIVEITTKP